MTPEHLRELLQAFALGTILALQAFEVSADLSQLQFQFGVTTACMRYKNTNKKKKTHVQRQQDKQETALKYFINTHQTELF